MGFKEVDEKDVCFGFIIIYEDVVDFEDEYFLNWDRIMFDELSLKRRR